MRNAHYLFLGKRISALRSLCPAIIAAASPSQAVRSFRDQPVSLWPAVLAVLIILAGGVHAPAARAASDDVYLGPYGGLGGSHYEYRCEDNGYLVGIQVYAGSWIDSVQAICAKYDRSQMHMH